MAFFQKIKRRQMFSWLFSLWIGVFLLGGCQPEVTYSQLEDSTKSLLQEETQGSSVSQGEEESIRETESMSSGGEELPETTFSEETSSQSSPSSQQEESSMIVSQEPTGSFVSELSVSGSTDSIIAVVANGIYAQVSMHEKNETGVWTELLLTDGYVGYNGVGQASEGSATTPQGVFPAGMAFGVQADPGCPTGYTVLNNSHYWVDDPSSAYYNQFVSTDEITPDWNSAEHLISATQAYAYCLEIGYNQECVPGAGSAMFLHCLSGGATLGCVAIPQSDMQFILQHVRPDTLFVIANEEDLYLY